MTHLVVAHLLDDGEALGVGGRQTIDVTGQMLLDLSLGLDDESEIGPIAGKARRDADRESAGIPERIE